MYAINALLLATESTAESEGGLSTILPANAELVYGFISFVIVYFILSKYAFPRIAQLLDERSAAIQGRMEEAEQKYAEAEQSKKDYDAKIAEARAEANRLVEEAKSTAESLRRDIIAKAEAEAQAIVSRAQTDVQAERDRALQQLRGEVGQISVELASKIIEKELDASAHQELVDEYIQRLSRSN